MTVTTVEADRATVAALGLAGTECAAVPATAATPRPGRRCGATSRQQRLTGLLLAAVDAGMRCR